jgi:hypothetical protein
MVTEIKPSEIYEYKGTVNGKKKKEILFTDILIVILD